MQKSTKKKLPDRTSKDGANSQYEGGILRDETWETTTKRRMSVQRGRVINDERGAQSAGDGVS